MRRSLHGLFLAYSLLAAAACANGGTAIHELPVADATGRGEGFFDTPWPTDLRRTTDGHIDLTAFPNPFNINLLRDYKVAATERLTGYSVSAPAYFRFDVTLDEDSVETGASGASVVAVAVSGPQRGSRHPITHHYYDTGSDYWPAHTLAVRPLYGIPYAPETTYVIALTRGLQADAGGDIVPSATLVSILGGEASPEVQAVYAPALEALETAGVSIDDIANLTVFTTQNPTRELEQARDWLAAQPAPEIVPGSTRFMMNVGPMHVLEGAYRSLIFQTGEAPYLDNGGEVRFEAGAPVVQGSFNARYALALPMGEPPPTGWPVVLYAHGTGGDYLSQIRNGVAQDLAERGIASMGVDQIHHGDRNPTESGPEGLVFNFANPLAFRDNARQSALDLVSQARFIREHADVAVEILGEGEVIDPERVMFYGHSQGGLNGPIFLAIDDQAKGGVLSGAGGHLAIALVDKVEPFDIPQLVGTLLRFPPGPSGRESAHLVYEHPALALLQTWTDVADPTNYAPLIFKSPRPGFAPKSVLQTEGLTDLYTPPRAIEALATAAGIPVVEPVLSPIVPQQVAGLAPVQSPVRGNVAMGAATAGLIQADGGHFVATGDDSLRARVNDFLASFANGLPTIP